VTFSLDEKKPSRNSNSFELKSANIIFELCKIILEKPEVTRFEKKQTDRKKM